MELEHSFTVPVPIERAWDVLLDVERVAPCMPGASLDSVDGDDIAGRIKVKVGPISMTYAGTARFTQRDKAAGVVTLEAAGKETRGAGTASATVRSELTADGDKTHVTVHTSMNVTGKPAQFGRGVMTEVGGKLIGIFATNLAAMLSAEPEPAGPEPADAPERLSDAAVPAASAADLSMPIDELNLPTRIWSSLRQAGIQTVGDLIQHTPEQLLAMDKIGPASLTEVSRRLAGHDLTLAEPPADSNGTADAAAPVMAEANGDRHPSEEAEKLAAGQPGSGQPAASAASGRAAVTELRPVAREPVGWQPDDDAIDLLGVAGLPVLKRALPVVGGLVLAAIAFLGIRRKKRHDHG